MNLFQALRPECIEVLPAGNYTKQDMLEKISDLVSRAENVKGLDKKIALAGLSEREKLGTTGFGEGVGIPHCRLTDIEEFVVGILVCPTGFDFASMDSAPTTVLVVIVGPKNDSDGHLHLLSEVSHALHVPGAVAELNASAEAEAVREVFLRHVRDELPADENMEQLSMQVMIQRENVFDDILQVFSAMSSASVSVVDGHDESEYLNKLPLFSGFFSDEGDRFHRVILAIVQKSLANETIRQIDKIVGGLKGKSGVMVVSQDVYHVVGRLNS